MQGARFKVLEGHEGSAPLKHSMKRLAVILSVSLCLGVVYGIGFYNGSRLGYREGHDAGFSRGASLGRRALKESYEALKKDFENPRDGLKTQKKARDINTMFLLSENGASARERASSR